MSAEIDTANRFLVGARGDDLVILRFARSVTKEEALNLAAWLVALADSKGEFPAILEAVQNT